MEISSKTVEKKRAKRERGFERKPGGHLLNNFFSPVPIYEKEKMEKIETIPGRNHSD